ncbi:hypothetical protein D3C73_1483950 [compost metagenome]
MAAAAASLNAQAQELVRSVSVFKLSPSAAALRPAGVAPVAASLPARSAPAVAKKPKSLAKPALAPARSAAGGEWEAF